MPGEVRRAASGDEQPAQLAGSKQVLQLGVLCNSDESASLREECDHILHAIEVINDKADGVLDGLLPNRTIVTATRFIGCAWWNTSRTVSPGSHPFLFLTSRRTSLVVATARSLKIFKGMGSSKVNVSGSQERAMRLVRSLM